MKEKPALRLIGFIVDQGVEFPVIFCEPQEYDPLMHKFWCPWVTWVTRRGYDRYHRHGMHSGHRVAHCTEDEKKSPLREHGYFIRLDDGGFGFTEVRTIQEWNEAARKARRFKKEEFRWE